MTCRDCRYWDIDAARDKAGRVSGRKAARCYAPAVYARSVVLAKILYRCTMFSNGGADCPLFQRREGKA